MSRFLSDVLRIFGVVAASERGFCRTVHLSCIMLKERGIFVSYVISDVLRIFGVVAVCARAFAARGSYRTAHLSTPGLGVLNEVQLYESYDSYELTRSLN